MNSSDRFIAYVGCRSTRERNAQGKGIAVFLVPSSGPWEPLQCVQGMDNPSYLCLHPTASRLYAVHGDFSEVSTYSIRPDGLLDLRAVDATEGLNPVHLAISASRRWLLIANYASGTVITRALDAAGDIGPVASVLRLEGTALPHAQQTGSHPHQICFGLDGCTVYVPDKGLDKVFTLRLDDQDGRLSLQGSHDFAPGTGPRHMLVDPSSARVYVVGELSRTVHFGFVGPAGGPLRIDGVCSTVPAAVSSGSAAGIVLNPAASRLYISNRGHDSIASFTVDQTTGALSGALWLATDRTPRFIAALDDALIVAHEDAHSIWRMDGATLVEENVAQTGSPVCVVFRRQA